LTVHPELFTLQHIMLSGTGFAAYYEHVAKQACGATLKARPVLPESPT
jgi:hypothetical protein